MDAVLAKYGDDLHDGDAIVINDPYQGGMHLPDIFMFTPMFVDGDARGLLRRDLPSHRRRRPGRGLERQRFDRDFFRRACASRCSSSTSAGG
ncbi:MAG: hydantoinase B/oxoprolinase family protein [Pseudomonadota bacterium]